MSIESEKRVARKEIKHTLGSLSEEKVLKKSQVIGNNLLRLLEKIRSELPQKKLFTLGVYSPLLSEVNWLCVEKLISESWELAFPSFCETSGMKFRAKGKGLKKSSEFGVEILTPDREATELIPDICLIPGLAFSQKGERLGRGKGFYDRYLSSFEGRTVGLSFNEQILEVIPVDAHDVIIEFLVSESDIYWRGKPYKFQLNAEGI